MAGIWRRKLPPCYPPETLNIKFNDFLLRNDFLKREEQFFSMGKSTVYKSGDFELTDFTVKAIRKLNLSYRDENVYNQKLGSNISEAIDDISIVIRECKFKDLLG